MSNSQLSHLVQKSTELFRRHGIKNLTMDEIARELVMSKKTIYKFVENKEELVGLVMKDYIASERSEMEDILRNSKNSVDEMIQMVAYFFNQIRDFNPVVLHDMRRYYPKAWDMYNEYRFRYAFDRIISNLKNGVKEGFYRPDLDVDIIAKIYIGGIDLLMNQELFPTDNYVFFNLYTEHLNYYLRGIVSARGLKVMEHHNLLKK